MNQERIIDAALAGCAPQMAHTGNYMQFLRGLVGHKRARVDDVVTGSQQD